MACIYTAWKNKHCMKKLLSKRMWQNTSYCVKYVMNRKSTDIKTTGYSDVIILDNINI